MKNTDLYKQIERLKSMIDEGVLDESEIELAENKISALKAQTEKNFETEPKKNIIKEENKLNNDEKKISIEENLSKELEDDEIKKSETTENNFASTNPLTVRHGFLNHLVKKSLKNSEYHLCAKAFFLIFVYLILVTFFVVLGKGVNLGNLELSFDIGYFTAVVFFPFSISVFLLVVYIIGKRRTIQKRLMDDKAIMKYFSNKELGFFLFLVLLFLIFSLLFVELVYLGL